MASPQASAESKPLAEELNRRLAGIRKAVEEQLYDQALDALRRLQQEFPKNGLIPFTLGQCLMRMGNLPAAIGPFERAHLLMPKQPEPLRALALVAFRQQRRADEARFLKELMAIAPGDARAAKRLFELQDAMEDHAGMVETARAHLQKELTPVMRQALVKALSQLGHPEEALAEVKSMIDDPAFFEAGVSILHSYLQSDTDVEAAIADLGKRTTTGAESAALWAEIGRLHSKLEQIPEAMEALQRALRLDPKQNSVWHDLGVLQRQVGLIGESQDSFQQCLTLDPFHASALRVMGHEHKFEYGDSLFKSVTNAVARLHDYPQPAQPQVHYAMAKALEDVGDLDSAFAHYLRGGDLQRKMHPWQEARMRNVLSVMRRYIKAEDFVAAAKQGIDSPKPVFVVGMPRSGTTLLEQVIASHPAAFGAGELKLASAVINNIQVGRVKIETVNEGNTKGPRINAHDWTIAQRGQHYLDSVVKLAGSEAQRIVDKMPGNYHWLGPLAVILPNCHLIHSRRHPVEICLSEYRIFFPDGIPFSYNLRDLGKAYRMYLDYMAYWEEVLPKGRVLHVRYEDMVADLETEARKIMEHIQLPWDDACLKFYETKRQVKTASVTQVRKPIYTTSTNRWRKYEAYLKPLLEELGPLVAEYEEELVQADRERQARAESGADSTK